MYNKKRVYSNNKIYNKKGSILIWVLLTIPLALFLVSSIQYVVMLEYRSVQSNADATRAYYLAEAGLEEILYKLNILCEESIIEFLVELKQYKKSYLQVQNHFSKAFYYPPKLENYLDARILSFININNIDVKNPFEKYEKEHCYQIELIYNKNENTLDIKITGIYGFARKLIWAKIYLPLEIEKGQDEYNLPKIVVKPLEIIFIHQNYVLYN